MTEPMKGYGIEEDVKDHEVRIRILEKSDTQKTEKICTLEGKMDKIESNTTWILRLLIGSIVTALLALIIYGG